MEDVERVEKKNAMGLDGVLSQITVEDKVIRVEMSMERIS